MRVFGMLPETFACFVITLAVQLLLLLMWGLRWRGE